MNLVELDTTREFEHENHHILSEYLSHCSLSNKELVANGPVPRERIDSISDRKGKTYVLANNC